MPDAIDSVFIDDLRELMEDDFSSLLDVYLSESERQYAEVCTALDRSDLEGMRMSAHSLKGGSANVGAVRLAELCNSLETSAKSADVDPIPALVADVATELQRVRSEIGAILGLDSQ